MSDDRKSAGLISRFQYKAVNLLKEAVPPRLNVYPALVVLVFFIYGIILAFSLWPGWFGWGLGVISVAAVGVTVPITPGSMSFKVGVYLAAVLLTLLHLWAPWHNFAERLPVDRLRVEADVLVLSPVYEGPSCPVLAEDKRAVGIVKRFRLSPKTEWQKCRGKVQIRLPENEKLPSIRRKRLHVNATVYPPPGGRFSGDFDYGRYLRTSGIRRCMQVHQISSTAKAALWHQVMDTFFHLRDLTVHRILVNVSSEQARRLVAAMTLGYREALTTPLKQKFLRSGTFHIFAISGLHTGIVAGIFLFFASLVCVPPRYKYMLLPVFLAGYVGMTGSAPSAVRACIMISVWSVTRARLKPTVPVNSVAVAAVLVLLLSPLKLLAPGFIFSFTIVFTLLGGCPYIGRIWQVLHERRLWKPPDRGKRKWLFALKNRAWQICAISALAWIASFGLIAVTNARVIPGAIILNMIIVPMLGVVLTLSFVKIILGIIPVLSRIAGDLITYALDGLTVLAGTVEQFPWSIRIPQPPVWAVVGFYALLFLCLSPSLTMRRRVTATLFLGAWAMILVLPMFHDDRVEAVVFHGEGTGSPAILLLPPYNGEPILVNTGGWRVVNSVSEWLKSRGHERLRAAICPTGEYGSAAGLRTIAEEMRPRTFLTTKEREDVIDTAARSENAQAAPRGRWRIISYDGVREKAGNDCQGSFSVSGYDIHRNSERDDSTCVRIGFSDGGGRQTSVHYQADSSGIQEVKLLRSGEEPASYSFWRNEQLQIKVLP